MIKIGILGGGQLGKMLIEEANRWNIELFFLEKSNDCPAYIVNKNQIIGGLYDIEKINELAAKVDVLTYEIEHVSIEALLELESKGKMIIPAASTLQLIQDKGKQKQFFLENNIPTAPFFVSNEADDIRSAIDKIVGDKVVIKACKGGYDGKGVEIISKKSIDYNQLPFKNMNVVVEQCIDFKTELSVLVARKKDGQMAVYPCVEMEFDPKSNLVEVVYSPSFEAASVQNKAQQIAQHAVQQLNGIGLFAVEMLLDKNGAIYVNEIAPRPHNSGHASIEGNYTSQFEQLLRVLIDAPLGSTDNILPNAMINIVGPRDVEGNYELATSAKLLSMKGVYLHLYGKSTTSFNRKLGHITLLEPDINQLKSKANDIKKCIEIVSNPTHSSDNG